MPATGQRVRAVLDGYATSLRDKELALPRHPPYLVRWVRELLLFAGEHSGYTFEQTLDLFLAERHYAKSTWCVSGWWGGMIGWVEEWMGGWREDAGQRRPAYSRRDSRTRTRPSTSTIPESGHASRVTNHASRITCP